MRPDHVFVIHPGKHEGHEGTEVPTLGHIPLISEAWHQLGPRAPDPEDVPVGLAESAGEPESGDRGDFQSVCPRGGRCPAVLPSLSSLSPARM